MGFAKLNIWIRDEHCRPVTLVSKTPDYVVIRNCMGETVNQVFMPLGPAHLELDVPPGCYIIQGHLCEPWSGNVDTDRCMVLATCDQKVCVNLVLPHARSCAIGNLHPLVRQLVRQEVPHAEVVAAARLILRAGGVEPQDMEKILLERIESGGAERRAALTKEYEGTLKVVRSIRG